MDRLPRCNFNNFEQEHSIWQNGTTFHYFLEVAVIVIVMRLDETNRYIISVARPFKLIFQKGTKFENRLMRGLGTSTKFRLFTLSINYSTKPGHRCLVKGQGYKIELPTLTLQRQQNTNKQEKKKINKEKNLSYIHST